MPHASPELRFDDVPFRGIVEQSLAGVYVVLDERFMYANDTFAAMFGYDRADFIGRRMVDCVTPDSVEEVMRNYRLRISGAVQSIQYFTKGLRRDGRIVHLDLHASRVICRGRPALAGVALDVTERVARAREVERHRSQLRELGQQVNASREAERARIARELHDVLGGMLSSAKFDLARITRRATAPAQAEVHAIATDLTALMQDAIDAVRAISNELRPVTLDLLGLESALRQLLERFAARHQVAVQVHCTGASDALSPQAATQVFRIVQEALTNVARHAQARSVRLTLAQTEAAFTLRLADDGLGLDAKPHRAGALGLFGMAERAREIGGRLVVMQPHGGGTELVLTVPMPQPQGEREPAA